MLYATFKDAIKKLTEIKHESQVNCYKQRSLCWSCVFCHFQRASLCELTRPPSWRIWQHQTSLWRLQAIPCLSDHRGCEDSILGKAILSPSCHPLDPPLLMILAKLFLLFRFLLGLSRPICPHLQGPQLGEGNCIFLITHQIPTCSCFSLCCQFLNAIGLSAYWFSFV